MKFDLDDFDDRGEYRKAARASSIFTAIYDFDQWLRGKEKYNMAEEGTRECIENEFCYDVREKLREFMGDEDVNINEIT